jgi:AcrR family transcriptional regulator
MTEQPSTRDRIKLATIEAIEQYGIDQVTVRVIAEKAEANIASINYHFRSKEALLEEVFQMTIDHMLEDVFAEINREDHSLETLLQAVLFYLIDGFRRYPGITTAQLHQPTIEKNYQAPGAVGVKQAVNSIIERVLQLRPGLDPEHVKFVISRILGSIMFMMLTPGFLESETGPAPTDEPGCQQLARQYTELALAVL